MLTDEQQAKVATFKGYPDLAAVVKHITGNTENELDEHSAQATWVDPYPLKDYLQFFDDLYEVEKKAREELVEEFKKICERHALSKGIRIEQPFVIHVDFEENDVHEATFHKRFPLMKKTWKVALKRALDHSRNNQSELVKYIKDEVLPVLEAKRSTKKVKH